MIVRTRPTLMAILASCLLMMNLGCGPSGRAGPRRIQKATESAHEEDRQQAQTQVNLPLEQTAQPDQAAPVEAQRPPFNGPVVSLSSPDPIAKEHAWSSDYARLRFTRTGATDKPLIIKLVANGTATTYYDWVPLPKTLTFREGVSRFEITVSVVNDKFVEGDETIEVALDPSLDYEIAGEPAIVTIHDNDHWQWTKTSGAEIPKSKPPNRHSMTYLDYPGQSPAWVSLDPVFSASDNSVMAKYRAKYFDGGYFSNLSRSIRDSITMGFDFDPITGEIYLAKIKGDSRVKRAGELVGGFDGFYVTDNEGKRHHSVTVALNISVHAPGNITIKSGPLVVGKNSPRKRAFNMKITPTGQGRGTTLTSSTIFTLELKPVEDND